MCLSQSADITPAPETSNAAPRKPAKTVAGPKVTPLRPFAPLARLAASLLLLVLASSVSLAQSAANLEPGSASLFESVPPVPSVWGMPLESIPEEAAPFSPIDCFAEAFAQWHGSLQTMGGAYFSPVGLGPRVQPRLNFAPIDVRLGCSLYSPYPDDCCLRGNVEAILELTAAPIFFGFGDIIIGPTALLRYNFVQPDWRLVPYLQAGGGFVYNDAYRDKSQRALGQAGEFYLQATGGFHFLLTPHWSLDAEGGYLHISNAGTNERNGGINALGGSVGVTYFFGNRHE
jgi:lipid A 3-O-deacylase